MCRLYGFRSSHPSRVECELIDAQNALIRQAEEDARGLVNDDGWGIGYVAGDTVSCEREVGPAAESEEFRRDAASVRATTVLAHVRRATVGLAAVENTHPFRYGRSMLAHNGHVGGFDAMQDRVLAEMDTEHREAVSGTTDSEHVFQLLLSRRSRRPEDPLTEVLRGAVRDVVRWSRETDSGDEVALNLLWTVEEELVGTRLGRSLWYLERDHVYSCPVCGDFHPDPETVPEGESYRAVVLASERITDEDWCEVPEGSLFRVSEAMNMELEELSL